MAARTSVVLTLLLVAVVGLASAQSPASSPTSTPSTPEASSPFAVVASPDTIASSPDTIGAIGDEDGAAAPGSDAVEAPIGGPVSSSAFVPVDAGTTAETPADSSASMIKFSTAGLTLAIAGYFL
ncbi:hypothetical protein MLD38_040384 [Melastoma candidum]|uniref:Uncharacterized protein n=1 Tax=Melastoma candidum TaxID=119954 RepID=A0ACB9L672_9MYRT|nr:hypothetical protein MLD38_040384 [Melastoma candidum]